MVNAWWNIHVASDSLISGKCQGPDKTLEVLFVVRVDLQKYLNLVKHLLLLWLMVK
jgi:hypothetical protein